jgi:hypothetical protein
MTGYHARLLILALLCGVGLVGLSTAQAPAPAGAGRPVGRPDIPRHYRHIRIAMLAYHGNPMGRVEDDLLRHSVDLVVANPIYLKHIREVAPHTPLLTYSNISNLYLDLLTDWLEFADRKGASREVAFYHAAQPKPFSGTSPSSLPVNWFWRVFTGGPKLVNMTAPARYPTGRITFGGAGQAVYIGYPERFREINFAVVTPNAGCEIVPEYSSATDARGNPTGWRPLTLRADGTARLTQLGQVVFDPPNAWRAASLDNSPALFYVRFRTVSAGKVPVVSTILGRDYVGARGSNSGTVPVFDSAADRNGDGYLDDEEYARRAPGKDARFLYESRMPTELYGQMRFLANPTHRAFREWVAEHHRRLLAEQPLASGIFMDNSHGRIRVKATEVREPVSGFPEAFGELLGEVGRAVAPKWVLPNTSGGRLEADPVVRHNPAYFEEFAFKPMAQHWFAFEEMLDLVDRRQRLTSPPPLAVIDVDPEGGAPGDGRTQLACLAAYYLVADPVHTFLCLYGGFEPATTWERHWTPAAAYDIGRPMRPWTRLSNGVDPADPRLEYRVYARTYEKALVLYRPLSFTTKSWTKGDRADNTALRHELGERYRPLRADGTLGEPMTTITLRSGEGAILVRVGS